MHRIVDTHGGIYLDADALAGAGFRPGQPVHIGLQDGRLVLGTEPLVRPRHPDRTPWVVTGAADGLFPHVPR